MPNTNFQTIHQMGGAINSFVKQATGRDAVQNIDMEHITVAQNHYYEDVDISGRVVSFNAGAAGIPLEKCLVHIEPVQEGTGDPSPDNVRPISGWTKAKVFVSPTTDEADGTTYIIAFPSEAGTVYGGSLDVTTGELVVDMAMVSITSSTTKSAKRVNDNGVYNANYALSAVFGIGLGDRSKTILCNSLEIYTSSNIYKWGSALTVGLSADGGSIYIMSTESISTEEDFNAWLDSMGTVQVCFYLTTPITYHLTPQEVRTLLGQNNIWADTGDIEVKFKNIKEFF